VAIRILWTREKSQRIVPEIAEWIWFLMNPKSEIF
jgi:hypothetical protein